MKFFLKEKKILSYNNPILAANFHYTHSATSAKSPPPHPPPPPHRLVLRWQIYFTQKIMLDGAI